MDNLSIDIDKYTFICPITQQYFNEPVFFERFYFEKDALLEAAINDNKDYIMSETLARIIDFKDVLENGTPLEVDGIQTRIVISK